MARVRKGAKFQTGKLRVTGKNRSRQVPRGANRHEQAMGWAARKPHAELTASPEADQQAAVWRQLAEREAERERQAASGIAGYVPRKAGVGYTRIGGRSSA